MTDCDCENGLKMESREGLAIALPCRCSLCGECEEGWRWNEETDQLEACTCLRLYNEARCLTWAKIPVRYARSRLDTFPVSDGTMDAWRAANELASGAEVWLWGKSDLRHTSLLVAGIVEGSRRGRRYAYVSWREACGAMRLDSHKYDAPAWEALVGQPWHVVLDNFGPIGALADARLVELVYRRSDRLLPLSIGSRLTGTALGATLGEILIRLPKPVVLTGAAP